MRVRGTCVLMLAFAAAAAAQNGGAVQLRRSINGLTVTPRVLVIGAHPDDDDPQLIAWLARGRMVETGYLSLTRGEGGDNFIGPEASVALGAVRTQETLAARRIDGGESFFTRAFDFGVTKKADDALTHWAHDSLIGDLVAIVRSFRPHVIVAVFSDTLSDGNGQHAAMSILANEVFALAADTARFSRFRFGPPWTPLKLYRHGPGLSIDAGEFDPVLGKTYADVALESRAQHRSQGLIGLASPPRRGAAIVHLQRTLTRVNESTPPANEKSIFDGIDTTFARLGASENAPPEVAAFVPVIAAYADSARRALDLAHPSSVVDYLAHVVQVVANARRASPWCKHPSVDAVQPALAMIPCDAKWLDVDASLDLVRRRATDALFAAAGITFQAMADRELVAESDTVPIVVTMMNHGTTPVTLADVNVSGALRRFSMRSTVLPDSAARVSIDVAGLATGRPWWIGTRKDARFPDVRSPVDGLDRGGGMVLAPLIVSGVAIPEEIRRSSDVSVTVEVAGATLTTSIGPIMFRSADPLLGVQDRAVSSAPAVTLAFERGLEWIPSGKPIDRQLRLAIKSFSDKMQTFALRILAPPGLRLDSLPKSISLPPHQQRELFLHLRGSLTVGRHEFGVVGQPATGPKFLEGFQSLRYPHIPPVHFYHSSGLYLQSVAIEVPPRLSVLYITGVRDDIEATLRQLGVASIAVDVSDLLSVDLSKFTTVVIGPRAYEAHPELAGQNARLFDFVRKGGTMLVLNGQYPTTESGVLAFPAVLSRPAPEHVTVPFAPVTVLDSKSRLLNFPNVIGADDWLGWVRERATFVPTAVAPQYYHPLEMHDPGEKENTNALLVAPMGKGTYIYSTLTFAAQLPGGVPGSARLLVNLLSASCRPSEPAARC